MARLRRAILAAWLMITTAAGCVSGRTAGEGMSFMELYPLARRTCDAELHGGAGGAEVTVRYPASLGEPVARRFLESVAAYENEVQDDYRLLRSRLAAHL